MLFIIKNIRYENKAHKPTISYSQGCGMAPWAAPDRLAVALTASCSRAWSSVVIYAGGPRPQGHREPLEIVNTFLVSKFLPTGY